MVIDVSSVLKEFGGKIPLDGGVRIPDTRFNGSDYSFDAPVGVKGSVSNVGGGTLSLKAVCEGTVRTQCARCMKDIAVPVSFELSETLMRSEDEGGSSDSKDVILFEGHEVSLDEIVENGFIMSLEPRYLCRDDCKGLCPRCGADLNDGDCGCANDDIDPRWAALADMIKKD